MGFKQKQRLRSGFTTGTAAAAAAKAAAIALFIGRRPKRVSVTLPTGSPLTVKIKKIKVKGKSAAATVVKDAGDDPDVTNGAEIVSEVKLKGEGPRNFINIKGGEGVGVVTRPGLAVSKGRPAINPVPMKMIRGALREVTREVGINANLVVTVTVPRGREFSRKTLNRRLGIVGGISILGTTGVVVPFSLDAYKESIRCALDIAVAQGLDEVVFSTGRSSEKAIEGLPKKLPPPAFILTGDHVGFALMEASQRKKIKKVTLAGQFAKLTKLAAGHPDTHYTKSRVDLRFLARIAEDAGAQGRIIKKILSANTAREVFLILKSEGPEDIFNEILRRVKKNARKLAGGRFNVSCILAGYEKEIVAKV